mmetsp:Transcript_56094/g.126438  ORF Transcript_56094/g.126438 Transcript_56094/m.126438 type:complete len:83 (-) Transcript_56094:334-582(-)
MCIPVGRPSLIVGEGNAKRKMRVSWETTIFSARGNFCVFFGSRKQLAAGAASRRSGRSKRKRKLDQQLGCAGATADFLRGPM